ncbi:hypothetical protein ACWGRF_23845 [Streptomyces zhihengii]
MTSSPDGGEMLGQDDPAVGSAVTSVGLWIAVAGSAALVLIGLVALLAGMTAGVWIMAVGGVLTAGSVAALRFRSRS